MVHHFSGFVESAAVESLYEDPIGSIAYSVFNTSLTEVEIGCKTEEFHDLKVNSNTEMLTLKNDMINSAKERKDKKLDWDEMSSTMCTIPKSFITFSKNAMKAMQGCLNKKLTDQEFQKAANDLSGLFCKTVKLM